MLEKLHVVAQIVIIGAIGYYIWDYISTKIGIHLVQKTKPTSIKEVYVKAQIANDPSILKKISKEVNKKLYIAIGLGLILYIIW